MRHLNGSRGFTLLEMLLALALGALLMATLSSSVAPLLKQTETSSLISNSSSTEEQLRSLVEEIERFTTSSHLVFPSPLSNGVELSSLAVQLKDTGHDMPADNNADGVAGIANMDNSTDRDTPLSINDDDRDGSEDEDPVNGIDDDNDGLIDEDPGNNNHGGSINPGFDNYDDNGDGTFDEITITKYGLSEETYYWSPFLPNSYFTEIQEDNDQRHTIGLSGTDYRWMNDDNEDGVANNSPAVTWSAYLSGDTIVCSTPLVLHEEDGWTSANLTYFEYTCMENVESFAVTRSVNASGDIQLTLSLNYLSSGVSKSYSKNLAFR